jgi:hypothetical protein
LGISIGRSGLIAVDAHGQNIPVHFCLIVFSNEFMRLRLSVLLDFSVRIGAPAPSKAKRRESEQAESAEHLHLPLLSRMVTPVVVRPAAEHV